MRPFFRRASACLRILAVVIAAVPVPLLAQTSPPLGQALDSVAPEPLGSATTSTFRDSQLRHPRVAAARENREARVQALFTAQGLDPARAELYLRAFKRERVLEVWAREAGSGPFARIAEFPVCVMSGGLGPKHREGDEQVPEGFYSISGFNPQSEHHLSLEVDYPNRSDRLRARPGTRLGGDIFVHGGCKTVGCLPMTDEGIEAIYWIAVQARSAGQDSIPIHIFPGRMDGPMLELLRRLAMGNVELRTFWEEELRPAYEYFEALRRVPEVAIARDGRYVPPQPIGFPVGALERPALWALGF